jgi:hypothetical protein
MSYALPRINIVWDLLLYIEALRFEGIIAFSGNCTQSQISLRILR